MAPLTIPRDRSGIVLEVGGKSVSLTNLKKPFWPELDVRKADLLQYYLDVSPSLLPHLTGRSMVMKRYPNGAYGDFFFMKRTPSHSPEWVETCSIEHKSGNVIDFPVVEDLASLLWIINLGCIDLNPWYSTCDDTNRPDLMNFDLDPVPGAAFEQVREAAILVYNALREIGMKPLIKTSGSRGLHLYVPIVRGPTQKEVWSAAKVIAFNLAEGRPELLTAEYRKEKRPKGRVLIDYNQNAWGRTLASVYSVRPRAGATVSTPISYEELEAGVQIEDFDIFNVPSRLEEVGDLWKPLLSSRGRFNLQRLEAT